MTEQLDPADDIGVWETIREHYTKLGMFVGYFTEYTPAERRMLMEDCQIRAPEVWAAATGVKCPMADDQDARGRICCGNHVKPGAICPACLDGED